jgi:hypothetical protein
MVVYNKLYPLNIQPYALPEEWLVVRVTLIYWTYAKGEVAFLGGSVCLPSLPPVYRGIKGYRLVYYPVTQKRRKAYTRRK